MGSSVKRWFWVWRQILCKFDKCRVFIFRFLFRFWIQLFWSLERGCSLDLHLPWPCCKSSNCPFHRPCHPSWIVIRRYQMGYWNLGWIELIWEIFRSERLWCEKFLILMIFWWIELTPLPMPLTPLSPASLTTSFIIVSSNLHWEEEEFCHWLYMWDLKKWWILLLLRPTTNIFLTIWAIRVI